MAKTIQQALDYSYLPNIVGHLSSLVFIRATDIAIEHLAEIGLTTKEFVTLEIIAKNPAVSQRSIAEAVGTKPPLLVKILDDLTKRGLIVRERSTIDRRLQHVRLTAEGELLREQIQELAFAADAELIEEAGLTLSEKETLLKLMQKLAKREQVTANGD